MDRAVRAHLDGVRPAGRKRDAETMVGLMQRATGTQPTMRGSIVGFGEYDYRYESGRAGHSAAAGFAARKQATVVYLADGVGAHRDLLDQLGPHTTGVGCVYLKDLDDIDLDVLEQIVTRSFQTLTPGTYTHRARESGEA